MTRGASKQTAVLSRSSEGIIQTSQQTKEKRLRLKTARKAREETEVRKANERIATTRALTVVQQEHKAQKVRQEEHDVDHMTEQQGPDHPGLPSQEQESQ